MLLAKKNAHPRDANIEFDEPTHVYTICGNSNYKSVTTWIHDFFPPFDADKAIACMRKGKNWGPDNKYYNMTDRQIKEMWEQNGKEASETGTLMHNNIEFYYNSEPFTDGFTDTVEYQYFQKYLKDYQQYRAYRTEWTVYSKKYRLAGSIDMVYHDPDFPDDDSKVVIADWKRSKEIKMFNKWEKGFPPLEHVDHCNYEHYSLQLNIYRMIIEKYYGKTVSKMFLVVIHPNNDSYRVIPVRFITKEIMDMLKYRKREIGK